MHTNSHPEYKEATAASEQQATAAAQYLNPALPLRERLRLYISTHALVNNAPYSQADAGRELGYSTSMVSKYLSGNLTGDLSRFELAIEDLLAQAPNREQQQQWTNLFLTSVSQIVEATFERIRKIDDVGLVCGPAGAGKTCACHLYKQGNPTCIFLTATRWKRDAHGMEHLLFEGVGKAGWDGHTPRMDHVTRKLRDSHRLVIIDNAHRLTTGAIELVCDAQDEAGFSVGLVGNESVLETIRRSDQLLSRIGMKRPVVVSAPNTKGKASRAGTATFSFQQSVKQMIKLHAPDANGQSEEVAALGEIVASKQGHLRALKKQLILAKEIKATGQLNYPDAFRAAHSQLIRDYALD